MKNYISKKLLALSNLLCRFGRTQEFKPSRVINIWEHKFWGDNIEWTDWNSRKIYGFSSPYLYDEQTEFRGQMQSGKVARFRPIKLEYKLDPHDMFFAELTDLGYCEDASPIRHNSVADKKDRNRILRKQKGEKNEINSL